MALHPRNVRETDQSAKNVMGDAKKKPLHPNDIADSNNKLVM